MRRARALKNQRIDIEQPPRLLIGGAAQHDAIDMQVSCCRLDVATPPLSTMSPGNARLRRDTIIIERRDIAVLPWRQALEPGLARMHDQRVGAGRHHMAGKRPATAPDPARRCRCGTSP